MFEDSFHCFQFAIAFQKTCVFSFCCCMCMPPLRNYIQGALPPSHLPVFASISILSLTRFPYSSSSPAGKTHGYIHHCFPHRFRCIKFLLNTYKTCFVPVHHFYKSRNCHTRSTYPVCSRLHNPVFYILGHFLNIGLAVFLPEYPSSSYIIILLLSPNLFRMYSLHISNWL